MAKGKKRKASPGDVATNRQASYRFNLIERFECGIVLTGTEVKSLREGKAQLKDSYATIRDGEVWLLGLYIPPYGPAARDNHEPERPRKRGKDLYDKRESIRTREMTRDVQRELREARR
jgi:SsrA-binding protein